jgi:hypothetical protein
MGTLIVVLLAILLVLAILSVALRVVERRRRGPGDGHDPRLRADRDPS